MSKFLAENWVWILIAVLGAVVLLGCFGFLFFVPVGVSPSP